MPDHAVVETEYVAIEREHLDVLVEKARDYERMLLSNPKWSQPSGRHVAAMERGEQALRSDGFEQVTYVRIAYGPDNAPVTVVAGEPPAVEDVQFSVQFSKAFEEMVIPVKDLMGGWIEMCNALAEERGWDDVAKIPGFLRARHSDGAIRSILMKVEE